MRPNERRQSGQSDLFRARLDQIVDLDHPVVKLAAAIDWRFLEEQFGAVYTDAPGRPPLPTRLMAGLAILKHMHDLSDEVLCERWVENPYYQLFCGEEFFCHQLPFDRSSLTRWRQRMGEDKLVALIQESLAVATRMGAAKPADFRQVVIDTTVQEKAIAFPTDAKLMHRARERLVRLAQARGVTLRQSYVRVGKIALIRHQRYAHAKQFKRATRALRSIRTMLGRVIRDITRKIVGRPELADVFALPLSRARRVKDQRQRQRGRKLYSLHAPEVECIGKGKAHKPYEFGVKVSVATPLRGRPRHSVNRCASPPRRRAARPATWRRPFLRLRPGARPGRPGISVGGEPRPRSRSPLRGHGQGFAAVSARHPDLALSLVFLEAGRGDGVGHPLPVRTDLGIGDGLDPEEVVHLQVAPSWAATGPLPASPGPWSCPLPRPRGRG